MWLHVIIAHVFWEFDSFGKNRQVAGSGVAGDLAYNSIDTGRGEFGQMAK